jgi:alpha-galactosidase
MSMRLHRIIAVVAAAVMAVSADARILAPTPPMGWNSWDSYGLTINERDYRANAKVLSSLKKYGWSYAVVDMGWYMANPSGNGRTARDFKVDANGLLVPVVGRFPSAAGGAGFRPLADWVHSRGLKFGIHIMRGIPRGAVEKNSPIAGSRFRAADAADTSDACGWDDGNWGIRDNEAGQAYYDSAIRLYAKWGIDFLKVDCIADHPYKPAEIRQIARAIKKSGRPILLSLSPGPTQLEHAAEVARYAQMWRISNDIWDGWHFPSDVTEDGYPAGVATAFDRLAKWSPFVRPGAWPDADMLPFGSLRPSPGMGDPRTSRLSQDEERTQFSLWAISRSPLMLGGNLTELDPFTRSLVTNRNIIAINQTAWNSHPVTNLPSGFENVRVWTAFAGPRSKPIRYIAFFNLNDQPKRVDANWSQLGIAGAHRALDLWSSATQPAGRRIKLVLPAHGSAVYLVQ